MSSPDLSKLEIDTINKVLLTPQLSNGPQIDAFEQAIARYTNANHAIGVNSGTSGLHLCVIAAGIKHGDLVITTPFSFIATANAILYQGGIPIFVDVEQTTGNINPSQIEQAAYDLTHSPNRKTHWLPPTSPSSIGELKAILPVHTFGQPSDMHPILATAQKYGLVVIEDACESLGATYKGIHSGTIGDAGVFGFYPNKQITTGEGGMIVTSHENWDTLCRKLRNQGRSAFDGWFEHNDMGYNYRLDELSAALGVAQMARIAELLAKREQVARWYNEQLINLELLEIPKVALTTTYMSWFVYVVRIKPPAGRDTVMQKLAEMGIPSRPYFTPIHLQPFYRQKFGYRPGDFPITEYLGNVSLALPFSSVMSENQVTQVCEALKTILSTDVALSAM